MESPITFDGIRNPNAVRLSLQRLRQARGQAPPGVSLPEHLRDRDVRVQPHALNTYDQLQMNNEDDDAQSLDCASPTT